MEPYTLQLVKHLKPLYVKGHLNNEMMIFVMLVDGRAIVNLMPYSTFNKLCRYVDELSRQT
jgi:hypothetical protein